MELDKNSTEKAPGNGNLKPPWEKGVSGNPKGSDRGKRLNTILKELLDVNSGEIDPITQKKLTRNQAMALKIISKASKGDVKAAREIWDRLEGKAKQPIELDEKPKILQSWKLGDEEIKFNA